MFQQVLSILKETSAGSGITGEQLFNRLRANHAFSSIPSEDINGVISFMITENYIETLRHGPGGKVELLLGEYGEKLVDHRSFYGVFKTDVTYGVVYRNRVIGELVEVMPFRRGQTIYLAAGTWRITEVEPRGRKLVVEQSLDGKRPLFTGIGGVVHPLVREVMLEILLGKEYPPHCDEQARAVLDDLGAQFSHIKPHIKHYIKRFYREPGGKLAGPAKELPGGQRPAIVIRDRGYLEFYTFTGTRINRTLFRMFKWLFNDDFYYTESRSCFGLPCRDRIGREIDIAGVIGNLNELFPAFDAYLERDLLSGDESFPFSKWGEYLPVPYKKKLLIYDYFDLPGTGEFLETLEPV